MASIVQKDQPPMPVVLKIDPHAEWCTLRFTAKSTDAELLGIASALASDPDFNPLFADIVDFSDVTDPAITESVVGALAAKPSLFSSSAMHIVIGSAAVIFRLGRRFKEVAQSSRPNFYVVKTRAEAYQILPDGNKPKLSPKIVSAAPFPDDFILSGSQGAERRELSAQNSTALEFESCFFISRQNAGEFFHPIC